MDAKRMGLFMKALRKEKGLTQEELAEKLYVSSKTVSRWETGNVMPDLSMLQNIADFYGVDIKELINAEKTDGLSDEKETIRDLSDYSEEKQRKKLGRIIVCLVFALVLLTAVLILLPVIRRGKDVKPVPETLPDQKDLETVRENYTAQAAEYDGCIVVSGSSILHGEAKWKAFLQDTRNGRAASVRIYHDIGTLDSLSYLVKDLSYDGSRFRLSYYMHEGESKNWTFRQKEASLLKEDLLVEYTYKEYFYLLTDDPDATMRDRLVWYIDEWDNGVPEPESDQYEVVFQWNLSEDPLSDSFLSDIQEADLNGDGIPERCYLGNGRTSGVFTFVLYIYGKDTGLLAKKTYQKHDYGYLTLHLVTKDGKFCVEGSTTLDPPLKTYYWPIEFDGAELKLTDEYDILEESALQ